VNLDSHVDSRSLASTRETVIALDDALTCLTSLYPEQGRLVELRYFGGLTIEETGEAMGTSPATVKRRWTVARAWLLRDLKGEATV
jgi:RNA polymerase sigma factor (sigma-70 family)